MPHLKLLTLIVFFMVYACGQMPSDPREPFLWDEPIVPPYLAGGSDGISGGEAQAKTRVPGSWIVAFRAQASREALQFPNFRSEVRFHQAGLNSFFASDPRVKSVDFITSADLSSPVVGEELYESQGLQGVLNSWSGKEVAPSAVAAIAKVDFVSDDIAAETLAEWEAAGRIWFADPNGISHLSDLNTTEDSFATWSTDYTQLEGSFGHLKSVNAAAAFTKFTDRAADALPSNADILANPPLIAVIDSGVDYLHPQLKNRIFQNPSPGASGCADDVYGCNVTAMGGGSLGDGNVFPYGTSAAGETCQGDVEVADKCQHGTHVAGIIAAEYQSSGGTPMGPAGVCPFCKIVVIKATSGFGGISDSAQLAGLKYVSLFRSNSSNAIRVVNASFGQFQRNRAISVIVASLRRAGNGIVVVAASGNEDTMLRSYPAALTDVIAVSATTSSNEKASFSNFGNWVDVAAPGSAIMSTFPGGMTGPKNGTSMAAPVVSGVVGLLVAYAPSISASGIRERIISTANPNIYGADTNPLNYQFYYARIAGESVPRPLLGSGLVQADGALGGKSTGAYTPDALQRVTPGCGMISAGGSRNFPGFDIGFLLLLTVPLLFSSQIRMRICRSRPPEGSRWV